jgi:4-hydroxy-4-methyl-2-oxoglutarate aldolase
VSAAVHPSATVADALVRLGLPIRLAPRELRRIAPGDPVVGPAVPCRHAGSVDIFLEAIGTAPVGSVLVIDNEARDDEACIGDLIVAEARAAGLAGIVVWGRHRDTSGLLEIGLPVWSLGACPAGPRQARPRAADALTAASVGPEEVRGSDLVIADDDGIVFASQADWTRVRETTEAILAIERAQAAAIERGTSLREQLRFAEYLSRRATDPEYRFRDHLAAIRGAIET